VSNHKKPAPWASTTKLGSSGNEFSSGDYPANSIRNKLGTVLLVAVVCIVTLVLNRTEALSPPAVSAQALGNFYTWSDSLATSTTAVDCTFATRWENVLIWAVGADLYVRVGAPDVSSWSSRKWVRVLDGMGLSYGPATKLTRFEYKTVSGSGAIFFSGTKRSAQF